MLFENSFSEFVDRKFSQENNFWQGLSLLRSLGEDVLSVFWGNTFFDVVWKLLLKFCWQFLARIVTTAKMQICNLLITGQSRVVDAKSKKVGIFVPQTTTNDYLTGGQVSHFLQVKNRMTNWDLLTIDWQKKAPGWGEKLLRIKMVQSNTNKKTNWDLLNIGWK